MQQTLPEAADQLEAVAAVTEKKVAVIEEFVADKGYHSRTSVLDLDTLQIRTLPRDGVRRISRFYGELVNNRPLMPLLGSTMMLVAAAALASDCS